jgi:hypothetical protein
MEDRCELADKEDAARHGIEAQALEDAKRLICPSVTDFRVLSGQSAHEAEGFQPMLRIFNGLPK